MLLGHRAVRIADGVLVAWTIGWLIVALVVARDVWRLRDLTDSAVAASAAAASETRTTPAWGSAVKRA